MSNLTEIPLKALSDSYTGELYGKETFKRIFTIPDWPRGLKII